MNSETEKNAKPIDSVVPRLNVKDLRLIDANSRAEFVSPQDHFSHFLGNIDPMIPVCENARQMRWALIACK